jgi:hypothetical protein
MVFIVLVVLITLVSTSVALAEGNVDEPVIPPKLPTGDFDDDYFNIGKTKLSSPFAFSFQQTLLSTDGLPLVGNKVAFYYAFVGGAPTKACFPQIFGTTTKVYGFNPNTWQWIQPGMLTKTEIHDGIKYRCTEVVSNGFYGLLGKPGEKFIHTYPTSTP